MLDFVPWNHDLILLVSHFDNFFSTSSVDDAHFCTQTQARITAAEAKHYIPSLIMHEP